MIFRGIKICVLGLLLMWGCVWCGADESSDLPDYTLKPVFDGMLFQSKPDLEAFGIRPLYIAYAQDLWTTKSRDEPQGFKIRAAARYATRMGQLLCLDIEHWEMMYAKTPEERSDSLRKFCSVIDLVHDESSGQRVGIYAQLPLRWSRSQKVKGGDVAVESFYEEMEPLIRRVDVLFPSLYTLSADEEEWKKDAIETIAAAKSLGKTVYPFIWPRYHVIADKDLRHQKIPTKFWRMQLQTCLEYADGVVIWGGFDTEKFVKQEWSSSAPWWLTTLEVIEQMKFDKE